MMCLFHRSCCMHIMRASGDGFLLPGFRHQGSPVALSQLNDRLIIVYHSTNS